MEQFAYLQGSNVQHSCEVFTGAYLFLDSGFGYSQSTDGGQLSYFVPHLGFRNSEVRSGWGRRVGSGCWEVEALITKQGLGLLTTGVL